MLVALGDSRGVRSAAMQIDGAVVPGAAGHRPRGASARLPRRRRRVVRRRAPAAARRDRRSSWSAPATSPSRRSATAPGSRWRPTGRIRRSPAASCRSSARSARPASRARWQLNALATTAPQAAATARRACASATAPSTRRRRARTAGARAASRPSASPSSTRSARYMLSDRATKYGLLFIALTFVGVGAIEVHAAAARPSDPVPAGRLGDRRSSSCSW